MTMKTKDMKKMILTLAVMCMTLIGSVSAYADASDLNRINVGASATMDVAPDQATVNFNVIGRGANADVAAQQAAQKMDSIRRALLGSNVVSSDIKTVSYYLNPQYNEKGKVVGYTATNNVQVTLDDITKVGGVVDRISGAGVDNINNVSFGIKNKAKYRSQLLAQAVENARQEAAVVANAGGRQLGHLLTANINSYNYHDRVMPVMFKANALGAEASAATEFEAKDITLSANVDLSFAMN